MRKLVLLIALCLASTLAQAKGLSYAVDSLQKAQQVAKQDSSKHVLIFYSSEN